MNSSADMKLSEGELHLYNRYFELYDSWTKHFRQGSS